MTLCLFTVTTQLNTQHTFRCFPVRFTLRYRWQSCVAAARRHDISYEFDQYWDLCIDNRSSTWITIQYRKSLFFFNPPLITSKVEPVFVGASLRRRVFSLDASGHCCLVAVDSRLNWIFCSFNEHWCINHRNTKQISHNHNTWGSPGANKIWPK